MNNQENAQRNRKVTRIAPSPTGALHLGNAFAFTINWLLARKFNWHIVLRIEDLDTPRLKPGADQQAINDLKWLGLSWDEGPYYQKEKLDPYVKKINFLNERGDVYTCQCTRKDIEEAASAPHETIRNLPTNVDNKQQTSIDFTEPCYPGTCRPAQRIPMNLDALLEPSNFGQAQDQCIRLRTDERTIFFNDQWHGELQFQLPDIGGDFVIWTKAGYPSYQLAVLNDDLEQGVTDVVRGSDLLASTARQILLAQKLDLSMNMTYWHHPLIRGDDGKRLAKRHGDTRISYFREQGCSVESILGLIAMWAGQYDQHQIQPESISLKDLVSLFDPTRIPKVDQICKTSDQLWLRQNT